MLLNAIILFVSTSGVAKTTPSSVIPQEESQDSAWYLEQATTVGLRKGCDAVTGEWFGEAILEAGECPTSKGRSEQIATQFPRRVEAASRERGFGQWAEGPGDERAPVRGTWDTPGAGPEPLLERWWKGSGEENDRFSVTAQFAPWTNRFWIKQVAGENQIYSHAQDLLNQDLLGWEPGI